MASAFAPWEKFCPRGTDRRCSVALSSMGYSQTSAQSLQSIADKDSGKSTRRQGESRKRNIENIGCEKENIIYSSTYIHYTLHCLEQAYSKFSLGFDFYATLNKIQAL